MSGVILSSAIGQIASPGYTELIYQNISKIRRGQFSGFLSLSIGLGGILGGYLSTCIMKKFALPVKFYIAFITGAVIVIISNVLLLGMHDNHSIKYQQTNRSLSIKKMIKKIQNNLNFRVFLFFFLLCISAQTIATLFIAYGNDILLLSNVQKSYFTIAYFAGTLLLGSTLPFLADRFGFRIIGIIAGALLGAAFLIPLLLPENISAIFVSFALFSGSLSLGGFY